MTTTADDTEMKIDPSRAKALTSALNSVSERIAAVSQGRNVRLVAVSKLKPASDILALYNETKQRDFGENYAQELMDKAEILPKDIRWHFIGGLQTNKCKPLASTIPNLFFVSSIDTAKKATALNTGRSSLSPPPTSPLNIHIQINTSGETSKSGVSPGPDTSALAKHIVSSCTHLKLAGIMTIGAIARSKAAKEGEENEDFEVLKREGERLEEEFKGELKGEKLELSMGMSEDFEVAVRMGSGEVRVGSTIFGERPVKEDKGVKGEVKEGEK